MNNKWHVQPGGVMSLHFMNSYVHYRINTLVMIPIRTRCERSAGERGTGAERLRCFPHPVLAGRWAEEWLVHVKTTDRRWMRLKESSSSVTDWHAEENERIRQALVSQWSPSPRNTGNMKPSRSNNCRSHDFLSTYSSQEQSYPSTQSLRSTRKKKKVRVESRVVQPNKTVRI